MLIKEVLEDFIDELKGFLGTYGNHDHEPLDSEDIGEFYIMICDDGSYYQVDMENSYWCYEDDGTIVFRVNDRS